MRQIKESDVKAMLAAMADNLPDLDRESLKDFLRGLIDHVTLDHSSLACCITTKSSYELGIHGVPRGIRTPVLTVKG